MAAGILSMGIRGYVDLSSGFCMGGYLISVVNSISGHRYRWLSASAVIGRVPLIGGLPLSLTSFRIISSQSVCLTFLIIAINAVNQAF